MKKTAPSLFPVKMRNDFGPPSKGGGKTTIVNLPPVEANELDSEQLRTAPFFGGFQGNAGSDFPNWKGGDWLYGNDVSKANAHLPPVPMQACASS